MCLGGPPTPGFIPYLTSWHRAPNTVAILISRLPNRRRDRTQLLPPHTLYKILRGLRRPEPTADTDPGAGLQARDEGEDQPPNGDAIPAPSADGYPRSEPDPEYNFTHVPIVSMAHSSAVLLLQVAVLLIEHREPELPVHGKRVATYKTHSFIYTFISRNS